MSFIKLQILLNNSIVNTWTPLHEVNKRNSAVKTRLHGRQRSRTHTHTHSQAAIYSRNFGANRGPFPFPRCLAEFPLSDLKGCHVGNKLIFQRPLDGISFESSSRSATGDEKGGGGAEDRARGMEKQWARARAGNGAKLYGRCAGYGLKVVKLAQTSLLRAFRDKGGILPCFCWHVLKFTWRYT